MTLPPIEATYRDGEWHVKFLNIVPDGCSSSFRLTHAQWLAFRAMQNGVFFTEPSACA